MELLVIWGEHNGVLRVVYVSVVSMSESYICQFQCSVLSMFVFAPDFACIYVVTTHLSTFASVNHRSGMGSRYDVSNVTG
jgi:hypothetical protein